MTIGDPIYDLIAACFKQAVKDAQRGQVDAMVFLDDTLPEWRKFAAPAECDSNINTMLLTDSSQKY